MSYNPKGAGIPCKNYRLFDYSDLMQDLEFVLSHIYSEYNHPDIYFVGFSLGSSYGLKLLSQKRSAFKVKGMVSVGNPYDVYRAAKELNSKKNFLIGYFATKSLIEKLELNLELILKKVEKYGIEFDLEAARRSKTTFEFD